MNIGDRVRLLHGTEEGIIINVIDKNNVEIEIEEGFHIPVLVSDLVIVASQEESFFSEGDSVEIQEESKKIITSEVGIYLGLEESSAGKKYELHLINNTDLDLLVAVYRKEGKLKYAGLSRVLIMSRSSQLVAEFGFTSLSSYNDLYCQIIRFQRHAEALKSPIERHIRLVKLLDKQTQLDAPIINRTMWLKQLDEQQDMAQNHKNETVEMNQRPPEDVIDLHAEALGLDEESMVSSDILLEQMSTFNKSLDNAIVFGLGEITFIHGVGQGVLRKEILKAIRNRKEIKYWEDAQKEKFGYGATKIVIK